MTAAAAASVPTPLLLLLLLLLNYYNNSSPRLPPSGTHSNAKSIQETRKLKADTEKTEAAIADARRALNTIRKQAEGMVKSKNDIEESMVTAAVQRLRRRWEAGTLLVLRPRCGTAAPALLTNPPLPQIGSLPRTATSRKRRRMRSSRRAGT